MRFLVAYDGTEGAEAALTEVAALAKAAGGEVLVLQVLHPLIDATDVPARTGSEAVEKLMVERKAAIEARLAELEVSGEARVVALERAEDVWERITRAAGDPDIALVGIGSRRAGGLMGALLGSVTRSVVQHSPRPVLVVRPQA